jgi:hypothetical protein
MRHSIIACLLEADAGKDVELKSVVALSGPARFGIKLFRVLFHANLLDSPFGWQVIATTRKTSE